MKKGNNSLLLLLAAALIFAGSFHTGAFGEDTAGTSEDPVVTKSYVDALVEDLKGGGAAGFESFKVVEVEEGQKVIGGEGTEMVLRGGKATAIDNGADGISDLTVGKDIKSPTRVEKNHLLLVPRDDGRGIHCKTHAYVLVKGEYTVE